jgi:hypothetical protein
MFGGNPVRNRVKLARDVRQLISGMALKYGAATVQRTRCLMQHGCKDQAGTMVCTSCSRLILTFLNPSLEYHVTSLDLTDRYGSDIRSIPTAIVFTRLRGNPRLRMAHRSITVRFELNCDCERATLRQRF